MLDEKAETLFKEWKIQENYIPNSSNLIQIDDIHLLLHELELNESKILDPTLDNGWDIVHSRTDVIDDFLKKIFSRFLTDEIYICAVGGMGRRELTPNSDIDLHLFYNNLSENDPMLTDYTYCMIGLFKSFPFLSGSYVHNSIDDIPSFQQENLGYQKIFSLMDIRTIHGNEGIGSEVKYGVKKNYDPLDLLSNLLPKLRTDRFDEVYNLEFNVKEGVGGIRYFNRGVFSNAVASLNPSIKGYDTIDKIYLDSVSVLLKLRSWINHMHGMNLRDSKTLNKNHNMFNKGLLGKFVERFGEESVSTVIEARKNLIRFAETCRYRCLKDGLVLEDGIVHGLHGLKQNPYISKENTVYRLLLESQKRGISIDPTEYNRLYNQNIATHHSFIDLVASPGDFYRSLIHLEKLDLLDQLIPQFELCRVPLPREDPLFGKSYAFQAFECLKSLDELASDESLFGEIYNKLGRDEFIALRTALLIKNIPSRLEVPAHEYLFSFAEKYSLSDTAIQYINFLLENKETLFEWAQMSQIQDTAVIDDFTNHIGDDDNLNLLMLFTYLDKGLGNKYPNEVRNILDLYSNCIASETCSFKQEYIDPDLLHFTEKLPDNYWRSSHKRRLKHHLKDLDKASLGDITVNIDYIEHMDKVMQFRFCAPQYKGVLWRVAGACYKKGMSIEQADIYSVNNLALDFFRVSYRNEVSKDFPEFITSSIEEKLELDGNPEDIIGLKEYDVDLSKNNGYVRMVVKGDDTPGLLYAISRILTEDMDIDISRINAYTDRFGKINDIFFITTKRPIEELKRFVKEYF